MLGKSNPETASENASQDLHFVKRKREHITRFTFVKRKCERITSVLIKMRIEYHEN